MRNFSPLRYPGGKSSLSNLLLQVRRINALGNLSVAEPYAGGAGASLSLLYSEETSDIYINDADHAIYNFWWSVVNQSDKFIQLLQETNISINEWKRQRNYYLQYKNRSRIKHGFSAFYLNRCNRSGIIMNGGPIGGKNQRGKWKLDARFNKIELQKRISKIKEYRDRIHVSICDGMDLLDNLDKKSTFFFIDPPYYEKGKLIYLNSLDNNYHVMLSEKLRTLNDSAWVLTYDDCPEIRKLYSGWAKIKKFTLQYSASERRNGKEILIVPRWITLPKSQNSLSICW